MTLLTFTGRLASMKVISGICLFDYVLADAFLTLPTSPLTRSADMNVHLTLAAILVLFFSVALVHV